MRKPDLDQVGTFYLRAAEEAGESRPPGSLAWPLTALFSAATLDAIEAMVTHELRHPPARASLAHGDFDLTHVFCAGGRYTGIIDFGEVRGTEPAFDLGHFLLYEREAALAQLLAGYRRVRPLPDGHEESIRRGAVLLALRQLCRWLGPPRPAPLDDLGVTRRAFRISELVAAPGR